MSEVLRFAVIVEEGEHNCSAYSPDLPGCVATGATPDETVQNMRDAIQFHLEGLKQDAQPIPKTASVQSAILTFTA